ncbi:threonine ammonia-lyase [Sulfolobales archaeon SCGC AB-777_K20]|nr:threonine ammonia-lyase [Sulfolobales archaeon SCGC AB-777_K20]
MVSFNTQEFYKKILETKELISSYIHNTPFDFSTTFSNWTGYKVYLKLENLQKTGSFKVRGAFSRLIRLSEEEKRRGVIAVSAGNHAQGVAYAASKLGIRSVIVMPESAPISKYLATKSYGAQVILYGQYLHQSMEKAQELIREMGLVLVHPYADKEVIWGQGTIGLELPVENLDAIVVPVGGGGLISGVAIAAKSSNPNVKIIGVQSAASPSFKVSKSLGRLVEIEPSLSIADGILVKSPSELTFSIINELVDDIVLVDDEEIAEAIYLLLERAKTVVEGAGAAPVAALLKGKIKLDSGSRVAAIISGGNIDLSLLSKIIEKALSRSKRIVKVKVIVPDKPGYLNKILSHVVAIKGNVVEVMHDRISSDVPPGYTKIYILFEVPDTSYLEDFSNRLLSEGIEVRIVE